MPIVATPHRFLIPCPMTDAPWFPFPLPAAGIAVDILSGAAVLPECVAASQVKTKQRRKDSNGEPGAGWTGSMRKTLQNGCFFPSIRRLPKLSPE